MDAKVYEVLRLEREVMADGILWRVEFAFMSDGTCFKKVTMNCYSDDENSTGWNFIPKYWREPNELYNLAYHQIEKGWNAMWHPRFKPTD
jgi:hypothetical protein